MQFLCQSFLLSTMILSYYLIYTNNVNLQPGITHHDVAEKLLIWR